MPIALLNGQPASAEDLRALAVGNYGHFTAMQVRERAVQGLDLHLQRLQSATRELFGVELTAARILDDLRIAALAGDRDGMLRLTVFARGFDYRQPLRPVDVDLLATLSPAAPADKPPLRVKSYEFVRPLPHIKHVGTFPLFHYRRQALLAGHDDALFITPEGWVSEGSIWNIGFWDGAQLIWPQAPALRGTSERLLQDGLKAAGVPQAIRPVRLAEVASFRAAFAANASGLQAVTAVDGAEIGQAAGLLAELRAALASRPWQALAGFA